jgi:hypothetical protein
MDMWHACRDGKYIYRILAASTVWKPSCRWESDIKMNLKETGRENVDCVIV